MILHSATLWQSVLFSLRLKSTVAMEKEELIETYSGHIAEDMFQHMCSYVGENLSKVSGKDQDYSLIGVRNAIQAGLALPRSCSFKLFGYELILETPMPFYIKFGCGQFWIGFRSITLRFKEEIVSFFRYLITHLLTPALEEYNTILYEVNRKSLKAAKLRSLLESNAEQMIKTALQGTRMKFEISFHTFSATLKLWLRKENTTVAILHYDTFSEDLQKTIAAYGNQH